MQSALNYLYVVYLVVYIACCLSSALDTCILHAESVTCPHLKDLELFLKT